MGLAELLAEPGPVDQDDAGLVDEVVHEVPVRLPPVPEVHVREDVQRPVGLVGGYPGYLVEALVAVLRPLPQLPVHLDDVVLGPLQRCPRCLLAGDVGADPRAELLHHALADLVHQPVAVHEVAVPFPPARHEVDLREAVQDYPGYVVRQAGHGEERDALVEDDLVVDLIGDDRDIVFRGDVADLPQVLL